MLDRPNTANRVKLFASGSILLVTACITDAEPLDPPSQSGGTSMAGGLTGGSGVGAEPAYAQAGGGPASLSGKAGDRGAAARAGADTGTGTNAGQSTVPSGGSGGEDRSSSGGMGGDSRPVGGRTASATEPVPVGEGGTAGNPSGTETAGSVGVSMGGQGGNQSVTASAGSGGQIGFGGVAGSGFVGPSAPWNLLAYLCPDRANRQRDWEDLEASLSSTNGLEVFALTEDSGMPTRLRHSAVSGAGGAGSIEVDVSVLGKGGPNLDLGDPTVLEAFLDYAAQASPNRRTALIVSGIASRTNGLWSLCSDDTPLGLSELQGALDDRGLELLALDGGKVFNLSMTYQLRQAARFLVSSQALDFSDFVGAWKAAPEDSARSLAEAIVETHDTGVLGVVSALDTQKMDALRDALDVLTAALLEQEATEIKALRPDACPGNYAGLQSVDMHALASLLQPQPLSVLSAVEDAVVAHEALDMSGHAASSAYGVAIYLPLTAGSELTAYTAQNYDLLASPHRYRGFIDWFLAELE